MVFADKNIEYLYPVGAIDEENILLIHQTSLDDLELWMWNTKEFVAFKELSSIFLPSCVQILPNKQACSFIDHGRIKIKYFNKRTPRTIALAEPIYAISCTTWIHEEQFYFVGKHEGSFKLFLCDISNRNTTIYCLSSLQNSIDYLYPQKIDDDLFCITKDTHDHYAICKMKWHPQDYKKQVHSFLQACQNSEKFCDYDFNQCENISTLVSLNQPACFLVMQDQNSGFFLKFTQSENQDSGFFKFICCRVEKSFEGSWSTVDLFNFELPKNLLVGFGPERIYESIYPFLPVYTEKSVYFVNFNQTSQTCQIARYDHDSGAVEMTDPYCSRSISSASHLFAPCIINNSIYCGISSPLHTSNRSLMLSDQASGIFHCKLPEIKF